MCSFADNNNCIVMTETELSIKLREDARRIGLCDKWYSEWKDDTDKEHLVDMFRKGMDFCIKHRWPSNSFIKTHFSKEFLRDNGILVDDIRSYPVRDESRRLVYLSDYALMGKSQATIRYSFRPHICQVWALDDSKVIVDVKYGAFIMIHLFDNASADITTDMVSKVVVIRHSHKNKIKKEGIVTIKNEYNFLE